MQRERDRSERAPLLQARDEDDGAGVGFGTLPAGQAHAPHAAQTWVPAGPKRDARGPTMVDSPQLPIGVAPPPGPLRRKNVPPSGLSASEPSTSGVRGRRDSRAPRNAGKKTRQEWKKTGRSNASGSKPGAKPAPNSGHSKQWKTKGPKNRGSASAAAITRSAADAASARAGEIDALKETCAMLRDEAADATGVKIQVGEPSGPDAFKDPEHGESDDHVIDIPEPLEPEGPEDKDLVEGAVLVEAEYSMLNIDYQYHEGGGPWQQLLRMIFATLVFYAVTRGVAYLVHHSEFHSLYLTSPVLAVLWLIIPGWTFWTTCPPFLLFFTIRDILLLRSEGGTDVGIPVRHKYKTKSGTLHREGTGLYNDGLGRLRGKDLRPHALSVADVKYLNAFHVTVEYTLYYLWLIPVLRKDLMLSGEVLVQVLIGKNLVASADFKSTALRMEQFANSLMVIPLNRYETARGIHRVPDSVRVAYGAYRQYMEQRYQVPFPYHPLKR